MLKVITELEKLGLKLTDEQKEAVKKNIGEEVYSSFEYEQKVQKAESERDEFKKRAETAENTLKAMDGKSLEEITKDRDAWKKKAEDAEKEYAGKLAEREKNDLINEAMKDIKFTSESAKKAIISQISENVSVKNGKLIGFNDLLEDARKNDAGAFVNEKAENNKAQFTSQKSVQTGSNTLTKDQIMQIKDAGERQKAIRENIGLFQGEKGE